MAQPLLEWWDVTATSTKLIIMVVAFGLGVGVFFGMVMIPYWEHATTLQREVEQLDHILTMQSSLGQQRTSLTAEVSELREQVQRLEEAMGDSLSMAQVLTEISKVANQAGLSIALWKPENVNGGPGHSQRNRTPAQLEIEGDYHGLARFFDELTRLPKALIVRSFSIVSSLQQNPSNEIIHASLELSAYQPSGFEAGKVIP